MQKLIPLLLILSVLFSCSEKEDENSLIKQENPRSLVGTTWVFERNENNQEGTGIVQSSMITFQRDSVFIEQIVGTWAHIDGEGNKGPENPLMEYLHCTYSFKDPIVTIFYKADTGYKYTAVCTVDEDLEILIFEDDRLNRLLYYKQ